MNSRCAVVGSLLQRKTTLRRRSRRVATTSSDATAVYASYSRSASFSEPPSETVTELPSTVVRSAPRPALSAMGSPRDLLERCRTLREACLHLLEKRGLVGAHEADHDLSAQQRHDEADTDEHPPLLRPTRARRLEHAHQTTKGSSARAVATSTTASTTPTTRRRESASTAKPKQSASAGAAASAYVPLIVSPSLVGYATPR